MRLKHIKGAEEKIKQSPYVITNPEKFKGNYKSVFENDNPIHIEIGMGKGNFIIGMARQHPDINFIGIEMYDSVLLRAVQKLSDIEINNLKLIRTDATDIQNIFDEEVDTIYLNFSDPWPKNRHEHRRLTSDRFLKRYDSIFKDKKNIIQKTDNRKLFEYSIIAFTNYGYKIDEISLNLHEDENRFNVMTEYEEKFVSKGYPIYMIKVVK